MSTKFERPLPAARREVLDNLKNLYPAGIASTDLLEKHGPAAKSRIGELRADGWIVETEEVDGVAVYRLASLTRGQARTVDAGTIIRHAADGWTSRTHRDALGGPVPEAVLRQAEAAALAAYRAIVDPYLAPPRTHEDACIDALVDALDELGGRLEDLRTAVRSRR